MWSKSSWFETRHVYYITEKLSMDSEDTNNNRLDSGGDLNPHPFSWCLLAPHSLDGAFVKFERRVFWVVQFRSRHCREGEGE